MYLYASLCPAKAPAAWRRVGKRPGELPAGLIVGSVEIVDCRWDNTERSYAYILRRPVRLPRYPHPKNQPMPAFWEAKVLNNRIACRNGDHEPTTEDCPKFFANQDSFKGPLPFAMDAMVLWFDGALSVEVRVWHSGHEGGGPVKLIVFDRARPQ